MSNRTDKTTAIREPEPMPITVAAEVVAEPSAVVPVSLNRLARAVTNFKIIRPLTPALVAMAHEGDMLFEPCTEVYELLLPVKGRSETMQPAQVIDGYKVETGEYVTLVCNAMIVSAFKRAGDPLKGRTFALRNHDMMADKAYRHIEVVEVAVETEDVPAE